MDEAIALCRVSTAKQRIEGSSLEAQEERVNEAAIYIKAEIVRFWSLNISSRKGKNYKRKDLEEMLVYAKQHKKVKFCIVDEPDRFMRDFEVFYYWKVRFREDVGVRLVYAKKPHLAFEDNPMALMEEMMDVFRAETSNQERIAKTTANMQSRVNLGYYPGRAKTGYRKSLYTPGLHEPDEPSWTTIQGAFHDVLAGVPLKEVVVHMNEKGFRTRQGNKLDLYNFKKTLVDPYYAGIIKMSNWKVNQNGLHKRLITPEQHTLLLSIVSGVTYKKRKKFNPDFLLSNIIECTECFLEGLAKYPRLVGYIHNNGKQGSSRKFYYRYRCRGCKKNKILRDELHDAVSRELLSLTIVDEKRDDFIAGLRSVWQENESASISHVKTLQTRLEQLREGKNKLVRQSLNSVFAEEDVSPVLNEIKLEIAETEQAIDAAQDIEKDFIEFVEFTMNMIADMQEQFWKLDEEHLRWCKQLLFPEGFSVSRDGKVYTPIISEFYRLVTTQKDPAGSSKSNMVGDRGVEPLTSTTSMWRSSQLS